MHGQCPSGSKGTPSIISTSRHKLPQLFAGAARRVSEGAYVLIGNEKAMVTASSVMVTSCHTVDAAARLRETKLIEADIVSLACTPL